MDWMDYRLGYLAEMRVAFALPRKVTRPRAGLHERAAERHVGAHRPLLAAREAFLAEWHRAIGSTYETTEGGRNAIGVLTGITS